MLGYDWFDYRTDIFIINFIKDIVMEPLLELHKSIMWMTGAMQSAVTAITEFKRELNNDENVTVENGYSLGGVQMYAMDDLLDDLKESILSSDIVLKGRLICNYIELIKQRKDNDK